MKSVVILVVITFLSGRIMASSCPTLQMSGASTTCFNSIDGQASVSISNGSGNYRINWSNGAHTPTITNLSPNTYTVTVKDLVSGCTASGSYVVSAPPAIQVSSVVTDVLCKWQSNGVIALTVSGGTSSTGSYSYSWDNGAFNNQSSKQVNAGAHSVIVKDDNNCTVSRSYVVNQPLSVVKISETVTNVLCKGNPTGNIQVSMNNTGTPPYLYSWSNGRTTSGISNLTAGNYTVTVTDRNGCVSTKPILVTEPSQHLSVGISNFQNVSCFGLSDGSISASVSGGTNPYSYSWSNTNYVFSTNSYSLLNIPSDVYGLTVTDNNGCTASTTGTVGTPQKLKFNSEVVKNVSCSGYSDGKVAVSVIGGTGTYTFEWYNSQGLMGNQTNGSLINVPADSYTVIITDHNGCSIQNTYVVTEPAALTIEQVKLVNILCFGESTGEIEINAHGGTPNFIYQWTNSLGQIIGADSVLSSLPNDTYTILVTDSQLCQQSLSIEVTQPSDTLIATANISPVICYGQSNGNIDITATGGTGSYQFSWDNSTYQLSSVSEDLLNFPSDEYYLKIIDSNNCVFRDTFFIPQPLKLETSLVGVDILCKNDATGEIDLTVVGGVEPYIYNWSSNHATQDVIGLTAGTYSVTVTDNNLCTSISEITLTEPEDTLGYSIESFPVICYGESNGRIELSPTGGTPDYSVNWNTQDTTFNVENVIAGWYNFSMVDDHGCVQTDSIEVTQPDLLLANHTVDTVTCFGLSDGNINISPTGGVGSYSFKWFNSDYTLSSQAEDLIGFPRDVYQLQIRDSLECLNTFFIDLPEPDDIKISSEIIHVDCYSDSSASIDITVQGGNSGFTYNWSNGSQDEDQYNQPAGIYTVLVEDVKGCRDSLSMEVTQNDSIQIKFEVFEVSCIDQYDGKAIASPFGGFGLFSFEWSNQKYDQSIDSVYGGDYSVIVTDELGCKMEDKVFVPTNKIGCIDPPNAFTPNSDNYNDTWIIKNIELYPNSTVEIFNRWGQRVYFQEKKYNPWTGIYKGQPIPSELYYYIININNKSVKPVKGTVSIIR